MDTYSDYEDTSAFDEAIAEMTEIAANSNKFDPLQKSSPIDIPQQEKDSYGNFEIDNDDPDPDKIKVHDEILICRGSEPSQSNICSQESYVDEDLFLKSDEDYLIFKMELDDEDEEVPFGFN